MPEFQHHIFICENLRNDDHPRGSCGKMGSKSIRDHLKSAITQHKDAIASPVRVNTAGCLDQCEHGPVAVIYPPEYLVWKHSCRRLCSNRFRNNP